MLAQSNVVPQIPLADWTNTAVDWITDTFEWFFGPLEDIIVVAVGTLETVFTALPALLMVALLAAIAFLLAGWRVGLFTLVGLVFVISLGLWEPAMETLALVLVAATIALTIGIPIGIIAAKSRGVEAFMRPVLDIAQTMPAFVGTLEAAFTALPALLMVAVLAAIAFYLAGWRVGLFTVLGLLFVISLDLWDYTMQTLALVLAAAAVSLAIGIPIGILAAKSRSVEAVIRPVLDVAQTMPAFVYLVPIVVLMGLDEPPALIATVVFAMPPAVRLTMLGIQQVPKDTVEAAHAFGSTPWQTLLKVELPLSVKSIMAGVNQVIMLSLSMVVIAALAGAGGLGEPVIVGLGQLDVGGAFVGGIGIVILAIMLDRVTRGMERGRGAKKTA